MKKVVILFAAISWAISVFAQAPERISYQAVIRNSSDQLVVNKQIGMKISIQKVNFGLPPTYSDVFVETHTPTTNDNGLISILIGGGTKVSGDIGTINWSSGAYVIKTDIDPAGGKNYTISDRSSIASVPFALNAQTVDNVKTDATLDGSGNTGDPLKLAQQSASKGEIMQWNGSSWAPGLNFVFQSPSDSNDSYTIKRFGLYHFSTEEDGATFIPEDKFLQRNETIHNLYILSFEVGWSPVMEFLNYETQYKSLQDGIAYELHVWDEPRGINVIIPNKAEYWKHYGRIFYAIIGQP